MKQLLLSLCCCIGLAANAQIAGKISDEKGEPLPFASIYVKGTSTGTTSNVNGDYRLELKPGEYELVFQYVGYKQKIEAVRVGNKAIQLNAVLQEQTVELGEIVVKADAEDPAYAVIRKAMEKRKYYRDQVEKYACDVYIKGNIKFLDAPEKFMGRDLGNLGGTLDTNRQGIVYLSESQSVLYYQQPNQLKEVMTSSKVSGNDNGFGFNSARDMDFNLYDNFSDFSRQIVSPIASTAMQFYRYRLVGTFFDEESRLINKIELIPKRSEDPVYRGYIYIVENLWNIQSADLLLVQGAIKQPGLDSLYLKQVYVPVQAPDTWRLFSQNISFTAGLFGFKLGGSFTGIYSNYDLSPAFEPNFFNNEIFKVNEGANERTQEYWDTLRPIPLTVEEEVDYVKKDSLQEIRRSKPYLDSIDRKNNKFSVADLFFGYNNSNSYERRYFNINSPVTTIQFNTVQGWNADINATYRKNYDEWGTHWWRLSTAVSYGFADKRLRATAGFTYLFDQVHRTLLTVEGGSDVAQFNPANPISKTTNSIYSLWGKENYLKIYDKAFGKITFQRELFNGVFLSTNVEYAQRSPLVNRTDFTWRRKDDEKAYTSNNPLDPNDDTPAFEQSEALTLNVALRLRYKQKYTSYPKRKFIYGSKLPDLWIQYRKGINVAGSDVDYDLLLARLSEDYVSIGTLGYFEFNAEAGKFLNSRKMQFMDFRHFIGNQTILGNPDRYLNSFLLLPYYDYSTASSYAQVHFQHHFQSYIFDKIPLLRKLGWSEVFKAAFLYTEEQKDYFELGFGIDNIGFGAFKLFRLDVAWSHNTLGKWDVGYRIGVSVPIDED